MHAKDSKSPFVPSGVAQYIDSIRECHRRNTMQAASITALPLARRQTHAIRDAAQWEIACRSGVVWITVDGDLQDYVLEAGESFRTPHHARALLYALADARVDLLACQSRNDTIARFSRFHAMPLMNAAR
jgi:hypothetical protein